jgi:hypothetical protein
LSITYILQIDHDISDVPPFLVHSPPASLPPSQGLPSSITRARRHIHEAWIKKGLGKTMINNKLIITNLNSKLRLQVEAYYSNTQHKNRGVCYLFIKP